MNKTLTARIITLILLTLPLAACNFAHKVEVPQGHIFDNTDLDKLSPGMSKEQVQFLIGEPIFYSAFKQDPDVWRYLYYYQPGGRDAKTQPTRRKELVLQFQDDILASIAGNAQIRNPTTARTPEEIKRQEFNDNRGFTAPEPILEDDGNVGEVIEPINADPGRVD